MAQKKAKPRQLKVANARPFLRLRDVRCIFHMGFCLYFLRVWVWHTSRDAEQLKGHGEFGWFFRYLTFCSFTLQTFQLTASTLVDLSNPGKKLRLKKDTDDLSCTVFATANTVTLMYYSLRVLTGGRVDESANKVPWVAYSVHILNTLVAWTDVLISYPRRFSSRSQTWTLAFSMVYVFWLNWIRVQSGRFPYPFLDSLPYPYGLLAVGALGSLIMILFNIVGGYFSRFSRSQLGQYEESDPVWHVIENAESKNTEKQLAQNKKYQDIKVQ